MDDRKNQALPELRRVDLAAPFLWLHRGLDDLRACPWTSLFYGLCFTVTGHVLWFVLRYHPEHLAAATAGFMLLAPALAIGLYDASRRRELGEKCSLIATLTAWKSNLANIGLFSLLLIVIFLLWARASLVTLAMFISGTLPTLQDLVHQMVAPENMQFVVIWFAEGFVFAALVFSISLVSIPLMLDSKHDAVTAALTSLKAVMLNPGAMLVWSAVIAWATASALLMGYLGMLVVGPLLGHATWHAYRNLVVRDGESGQS